MSVPKEHAKLCTPRCPLSDRLPRFSCWNKKDAKPIQNAAKSPEAAHGTPGGCAVFFRLSKKGFYNDVSRFYPNKNTPTNNTPEQFEDGILKSKCRNAKSSTKYISRHQFLEFHAIILRRQSLTNCTVCVCAFPKTKWRTQNRTLSATVGTFQSAVHGDGAGDTKHWSQPVSWKLTLTIPLQVTKSFARLDQNWSNGICMSWMSLLWHHSV